MKNWKKYWIKAAALLFVACSLTLLVPAQDRAVILAGSDISRVVPSGFYLQGLSAQTQMRNSAAARWGRDCHVIAGLVDTSGYAADVRAKYEGFLIIDSDIGIDGKRSIQNDN